MTTSKARIYLPDLIEVYNRLVALRAQHDIPFEHRLELAVIAGKLQYYVTAATSDVCVEVVE